jgi:hypothetical protein
MMDTYTQGKRSAPNHQPDPSTHFSLARSPGSGTVCTYLSMLLSGNSPDTSHSGQPLLTLAVDVNVHACAATLRTAGANCHPGEHPLRLEAVQGDLLLPLLPRLAHSVDILLFNPPSVCTQLRRFPLCPWAWAWVCTQDRSVGRG